MERYSRQILFTPIGEKGQEKLLQSTVLIIGAGALGTAISNHLVRSGIGTIRIVDRDYVELSNLQRQILFDEEDAKSFQPKAIAIKEKLQKINRNINIEAYVDHVSIHNIQKFTENVDVIMDGTDNFQTRYLLNDIAFKNNIPFSYGGVVSSRGMSAFFLPTKTPCLRCVVKQQENHAGETCDTVGVISPAVHMVTSIQVAEVLKYLTNNSPKLKNALVTFDVWNNDYMEIKFNKSDPNCLTCQQKSYPSLQLTATEEETVLCGRNTVQIHRKDQIDLNEWENRLKRVATTKLTPFLLQVTFTNGMKFVMFEDGRVLVQGTDDVVKARTWYDRYIGS